MRTTIESRLDMLIFRLIVLGGLGVYFMLFGGS